MTEIKVPSKETTISIVYIVGGIIAIVVIIIAIKKVFDFFGEDPEVRKSREKSQKDYEDSAEQILNSQSPTMSDAAIKLIADQIYEDLKYSALDDKKSDAVYQLQRVNNDADFVRLNDLFGTRNEYWFGINMGSAPFIQYVTSNLSRSYLDKINQNYTSKGIKFRW